MNKERKAALLALRIAGAKIDKEKEREFFWELMARGFVVLPVNDVVACAERCTHGPEGSNEKMVGDHLYDCFLRFAGVAQYQAAEEYEASCEYEATVGIPHGRNLWQQSKFVDTPWRREITPEFADEFKAVCDTPVIPATDGTMTAPLPATGAPLS